MIAIGCTVGVLLLVGIGVGIYCCTKKDNKVQPEVQKVWNMGAWPMICRWPSDLPCHAQPPDARGVPEAEAVSAGPPGGPPDPQGYPGDQPPPLLIPMQQQQMVPMQQQQQQQQQQPQMVPMQQQQQQMVPMQLQASPMQQQQQILPMQYPGTGMGVANGGRGVGGALPAGIMLAPQIPLSFTPYISNPRPAGAPPYERLLLISSRVSEPMRVGRAGNVMGPAMWSQVGVHLGEVWMTSAHVAFIHNPSPPTLSFHRLLLLHCQMWLW